MAVRYAVDTNVLLRLSNEKYPNHSLITGALRRLVARGVELCLTTQNIGEFWNVCTRPPDRNGLGLSVEETNAHLSSIERRMTLLQDDEKVDATWRRLLLTHSVRGVQVHDAHPAATLKVHGVGHILTFNAPDLKRFSIVTAVTRRKLTYHLRVGRLHLTWLKFISTALFAAYTLLARAMP